MNRKPFTDVNRVARAALTLILMVTPLRSFAANFTSKDYAVGQQPNFVLVYDFNGDGKPDIAVLNLGGTSTSTGEGTVSILLGNGDGTFQNAKTFDAGGQSPTSIAVADFNSDGKLDLAVAFPLSFSCSGSWINILLGNGDGTFQPATKAVTVPALSSYVVAGDVTGDGKPDLVVYRFQVDSACSPGSGNSVFAGNGDGTFQAEKELPDNDINGDGLQDRVSFGGGGLNVFLAQGNGRYKPLAAGPEGNSDVFTVGDFNNDKVQDEAYNAFVPCKGLFCTTATTYVGVQVGNGDGTFQPAQLFPPGGYLWVRGGGGDQIYTITPADFNGDGKLDVAYINAGILGFRVLMGNGKGELPSLLNFDTRTGPINFVVADLNGDGFPDVVLANLNTANITVALNTFPKSGADLAVTATASPSRLSVTQSLTYTISAQNYGPQDATSVVLTDTLPSAVNFVSVTSNQGTCTEANLVVTCDVNKLVSGDSVVATIAAVPASAGTITNTASAAATETDTNTANNQASASTQVDPMWTLTVNIFGTGTGSVTVNGGTPCASTCTLSFPVGIQPYLLETPDPNIAFGNWGGACNGTGINPVCEGFTMNSNQTVTAEFDQLPDFLMSFSNWQTLSVQQGGSVTETVQMGPAGNSFSGTIALTCAVQGAGELAPACTVSPSSVTLSGSNGGNSTLTITTVASTAVMANSSGGLILVLALPLFGIPLIGARRPPHLKSRQVLNLSAATLITASVISQLGCRGGSITTTHGSVGTAVGNCTVTVTGTSGSLKHSINFGLTVN